MIPINQHNPTARSAGAAGESTNTPRPGRATMRPRRLARPRGFTLMEVLVALGIFTLGAVAVASIFPVAILLQKETVNTVEAKNFGRSAEQLVDTLGFQTAVAYPTTPGSWADVENNGAGVVSPLPTTAFDGWSIDDRSYNSNERLINRSVFWVPLVYDNNPAAGSNAWQVYLFVVRGRFEETYTKGADPDNVDVAGWADANATTSDSAQKPGIPGVCLINTTVNPARDGLLFDNAPTIVFPGDEIVGENGVVYTVDTATATGIEVAGSLPAAGTNYGIWAAHPGSGSVSSFVKLITLSDDGSENHLIREP